MPARPQPQRDGSLITRFLQISGLSYTWIDANAIGQKVVDERVTITSDPLDPDAPAAVFTAEGLPTKRVPWIENGVVKNLVYDRYWAHAKPILDSLAEKDRRENADYRARYGGKSA